ncbi:hypothetical protein GCM10027614_83880 [Micromonospora vulcania]
MRLEGAHGNEEIRIWLNNLTLLNRKANPFLCLVLIGGDCKFIEPVMPEIEAENEDFVFYHVDRDEFIDLCADLAIFGIPSFLAFEDGEEVGVL